MPNEPFTAKSDESWETKMVRDWLRKPFPPEQIGTLPASNRRPSLSFVGHAAVTDRLNKIAPDWHYTVDTMSELNGKVWIRGTMTIGGVSRPEFGDGDDPKEAIGNFIRRGAMRFGVAIDLWSREELESASPQSGADAGGRIENTSSASRESSEGTAESLGEGGSEPSDKGPGETSKETSPPLASTSLGPTFPLKPDECDHKTKTGRWLPARQLNGVPVCPRCGLSAVIYRESAA